jgi:hypothetical protein
MKKFVLLLAALVFVFFLPLLTAPHQIFGNFGDVFSHYYPLKYQIKEQLINGRAPLWNPYIFCGQPLAANPQGSVFYPLSVIFYFFPLVQGFNLFVIAHLLLAGLFFYLLCRTMNFSGSGSAFGALAFAFSSFLIFKIPAGHPMELSGYAWFPVIAAAIENLRKKENIAGAVFLSLALSFSFLSGHIFPFYLAACYLALRLIFDRFSWWKSSLLAFGSFSVLCAVQLVPTMELSQVTETSVWPQLTRSYSLPIKNLINLTLPNFFGNVMDGTFAAQQNPSFFFERNALYFGLLPLVFGLIGIYLFIRNKNLFLPVLFAVSLAISLGTYTPLYKAVSGFMPGMNFLRVPARFFFLSQVALALAGVFAWDKLFGKGRGGLKLLIILIAVADLFIWNHKFIYPETQLSYTKNSEITELVNPLFRIITDPLNLPANRAMLYHQYNANGYEAILLEDYVRYLGLQEKDFLNPTGLARADFSSPLSKGLSIGYDVTFSTLSARTLVKEFPSGLKVYSEEKPLPRAFIPERILPINSGDVYDEINYLRQTPYAPDREITVTKMPGGFLSPGNGPVKNGNGKIFSFFSEPDRIEISAEMAEPGALVVTDISYSGWKAWAGGKRVFLTRGDRIFRAMFLEKGIYTNNNKIIMYFDPVSWRFGVFLSALALLSLAVFFFIKISYQNEGV